MREHTVLIDSLVMNLERSAEWRRDLMEQYPQDAKRNFEAAKIMDTLAEQLVSSNYDEDRMRRYAALCEDEASCSELVEREQEIIQRIGFHYSPASADHLLQSIIDRVSESVAA